MDQGFQKSLGIRGGQKDTLRDGRPGEKRRDEVKGEFRCRMTDHHGVGIVSGHHVFRKLELFIEFLSRLTLRPGGLSRNLRHGDDAKSVLVLLQIVLQRLNELSDNSGRQHHAGSHLLRLLHSQKKVHDELMLSLKDNGTRTERAASHMRGHQGPDMAVSNFLAVRTVVRWTLWMRLTAHRVSVFTEFRKEGPGGSTGVSQFPPGCSVTA